MAIRLTAVLCVLASTSTAAQQFPRLQEDNLNGQQVVLPDAANGKIAVLVLGFSHASQNPTGAWMKRIQADYATNSGFVVYQLAVIEDAPKFIRGMITSGMKKGVAENQRPFFLPVVHNEADLKKLVGYKEEDDAYIVVLGRTGKVAYQTHGTPADAVYADFRVKVNSLLK
jgi:hypothetical protein